MDTYSNPENMTKSEVARYLRVTTSAVDKWRQSGKLPHFRTPGGMPRFRREDVEALREMRDTA